MDFYTIDIKYIKYLHSFDSEVYLNQQRHDLNTHNQQVTI